MGADDLGRSRPPRQTAAKILHEIFERSAYTAISIDRELRRRTDFNQTQRNLITELVNGTVRMSKHLDWVLNLFLKKPIDQQNAWLRVALRLGAYQLLFMDRIPAKIAVDSAVGMVKERLGPSLAGVCNGVLRELERNRGDLPWDRDENERQSLTAIYYSQPEWIVQILSEELEPLEQIDALQYYNQRPGLSLRCNRLRLSPQELLERLADEDVVARASAWLPEAIQLERIPTGIEQLPSYKSGYYYIQSESTMLAAPILDPGPGETVLDFCCGVGGKSSQFAEWMGDQGHILALDLYPHKIRLLEENLARLGLTSVNPQVCDLLQDELSLMPVERIFIDAPCSGLGVLNRRADLRWRMQPDELHRLYEIQYNLLKRAAILLKPGGSLVYATCTINHRENQQQIDRFLSEHLDYQAQGFSRELAGLSLRESDRAGCERGSLTIVPGVYNSDGMFYAKLQRIEAA